MPLMSALLRNLLRRHNYSQEHDQAKGELSQSPLHATTIRAQPDRAVGSSPSLFASEGPTVQRVARVYIASTFRDMARERDLLVKRVFPELRERCRARQVEVVEIDLRWGITEEQVNRGETVSICLAEIDNCRPYFICLLGERYGWVPEKSAIPLPTYESYPWLRTNPGRSITELEILHGALNDPAHARAAAFYFRDAAFQRRISKSQRRDFLAESASAARNLKSLKRRIQHSGLTLTRYSNPEAVCDYILQDLWERIERDFPLEEVADPLTADAAEQLEFAHSRVAIYVRRTGYEDRITQHVSQTSSPLVVTGLSGMGKSSLLASWTLQRKRRATGDFCFLFFIGSTPQSADYVYLLKRLYTEIKRYTNIEDEIPVQPNQLIGQLPFWLESLSIAVQSRGAQAYIVLDALDQLDGRDDAALLEWLPAHLPERIHLIVSSLPGASLDVTHARGFDEVSVLPFDMQERQAVIDSYLRYYHRALSPQRVEAITQSKQTENALFLRVLLNELRLSGAHDTLDAQIEHYLSASDPRAIYDLMLQRLETESERDCPGLTRAALSAIWAARRGLGEAELLEVLKRPGESSLPRALWSPLYLTLKDALVMRGGLLNFAHNYLRQAIRDRYIETERQVIDEHVSLARHFADVSDKQRWAEEYPWHLLHAQQYQQLAAALCEVNMFLILSEPGVIHDLVSYWQTIGARVDFVRAMEGMLTNAVQHRQDDAESIFDRAVELAYLLGNIDGEQTFIDKWRHWAESGGTPSVKLLLRQASVAHRTHRQLDAVRYAREAAQRAISPKLRLEAHLLVLEYLAFAGSYPDALDAAKKLDQQFSRLLHDDARFNALFHHKASFVFHETDDNATFAQYNHIAQEYYLESHDRYNYCIAMVNQGDGLWGQGDVVSAKRELVSAREHSDQWKIAHAQDIAHICLANLYSGLGETGNALELYASGNSLARQIGHGWDELYGSIYQCLAQSDHFQQDRSKDLMALSEQARAIGEQYLRDLAMAYACISSLYSPSSAYTAGLSSRLAATAAVPSAKVYGSALALVLQPETGDSAQWIDTLIVTLPAMTGLKGRPGVVVLALEHLKARGAFQRHQVAVIDRWIRTFVTTELIEVDRHRYGQLMQ